MDSKQLNAIIREVIDAMGDEVDMWDVTDKVMAQIPRAELKSVAKEVLKDIYLEARAWHGGCTPDAH